MQVPRSKKSYGICMHLPESCLVTTLFRLAKTNAEACSGKYWHSRNQKQIPLQHGAQISCSAWYRGPLYSFLEFGPGGPPTAEIAAPPTQLQMTRKRFSEHNRQLAVFGSKNVGHGLNGPVINHDFPMINHDFPVINHDFPMINHDFPVISNYFSMINHDFPAINNYFPMINHDFPVINNYFPMVNHYFSVI